MKLVMYIRFESPLGNAELAQIRERVFTVDALMIDVLFDILNLDSIVIFEEFHHIPGAHISLLIQNRISMTLKSIIHLPLIIYVFL